MAEADRDAKLREAAANRGLKLVKSRRRTPGVGDYGRYGLADASGRKLFGFGEGGLTATPDEIEAWLQKGLAANWKSSLKSAGPAPRKSRRNGERVRAAPEPKAEPEPEAAPEPTPLRIREAKPRDAEAMSALLAELGFPAEPAELKRRLARLVKAGEPPLVAEREGVIGLLTWHVTPVLHRPNPVGRITTMVVAGDERRAGAGRALVEAAARRCAAKSCGLIEVTSNIDLGPAHAFYRSLGFERTSYRFVRELAEAGER
ncbi:MAG TPA: GNAT family N-acetyltransferase [Allosphingosinicella sp.]|nr:GNAT family N-acetyltransferase [Allosphingosinicella sp.]